MKKFLSKKTIVIAAAVTFAFGGVYSYAAVTGTNSVAKSQLTAQQKALKDKLLGLNKKLQEARDNCGIEQGIATAVCRPNQSAVACADARKAALRIGVCSKASDVESCVTENMSKTAVDVNQCPAANAAAKEIQDALNEARLLGMSDSDINIVLAEVQTELSLAATSDIGDGGVDPLGEIIPNDPQSGYLPG